MKNINLNNYESYFLDFAEGNLTGDESKELLAFLGGNPHLRKELDEFELIELQGGMVEGKEFKQELLRDEITGLKKVDYLMIAEAESVISIIEKAELSNLVNQKPQLIDELAIYHKTKLIQDNNIKYENKESLKEKERRITFWLPISSAVAAAAIIFFVILNNVPSQRQYIPKELSLVTFETNDSNHTGNNIIETAFQKERSKNIPKILESTEKSSVSITKTQKLRAPLDVELMLVAMDPLSFQVIKVKSISTQPKKAIKSQFTLNLSNEKDPVSDQFLTIYQLAIKKIKKNVLNNKSVVDALIDEIASLSNDKIKYQKHTISNNKSQRFAINIGKFGYSNF